MSSPSPYLKNDNFRIQIADEFNDYLKEQEKDFIQMTASMLIFTAMMKIATYQMNFGAGF